MALVLAIEPDLRQSTILKRIVRESVKADLVVVDSRDAALDAIRTTVPDVILLSALLSPRDEDELVAHLRKLEGAQHLQTHTIPQLASSLADSRGAGAGRGLLKAFRRKKDAQQAVAGCDPDLFAEEIRTFLEQAEQKKKEHAEALQYISDNPASKPAADPAIAAPAPMAAAAAETAGPTSSWESPFEWRKSDAAPSTHVVLGSSSESEAEAPAFSKAASRDQEAGADEAAQTDPIEEPAEVRAAAPDAIEAPREFAADHLTVGAAQEEAAAPEPMFAATGPVFAPAAVPWSPTIDRESCARALAEEADIAFAAAEPSGPEPVAEEVPAEPVIASEPLIAQTLNAEPAFADSIEFEPVVFEPLVFEPVVIDSAAPVTEEAAHARGELAADVSSAEHEISLDAIAAHESPHGIETELEADEEPIAVAAGLSDAELDTSDLPSIDALAPELVAPARREAVRLGSLATWARLESRAAAKKEQEPGSDMRELIAHLAVPYQIAGVTYPRGVRIRRVRIGRGTDRGRRSKTSGPVILSRRALEERRSAST